MICHEQKVNGEQVIPSLCNAVDLPQFVSLAFAVGISLERGGRATDSAVYINAHSKTMVMDREVVITGSFNFTKAAEEHDAENLLIIRDAGMAKLYMEDWSRKLSISSKE